METYQFSTALADINSIKQGDTIRFPCPAKLNLFLYINNKRSDGYHELQTLFQFLDYGDWLTISPRKDSEIILTPKLDNLKTEDNLIYRAAKLLQQRTNCNKGANLHLDKILPMGGGVGGGSSNAATALVALNYLWNTNLSIEELAQLGLKLGADVPIFVTGQAAIAEGVGEKFTPCQPEQKWYLVLKPDVSISTVSIFQDLDLTRDTPKRTIEQLLNCNYYNDCEPIVRKHYKEVDQLINWLQQYAPTRLTGTGACVFAEFNNEQAAQTAFAQKPDDTTGFVTQGCNISPLHRLIEQLDN